MVELPSRRPKFPAVPNPTRRAMRPVQLITDRAKRYRANAAPPPGPRRCNFCASRRNVDIDHITGNESHGAPRNLIYLCRSCNGKKANVQKRQGIGKRTRQYNPEIDAEFATPDFAAFVDAIKILRGDEKGNARSAAEIILSTPAEDREQFGDLIELATKANPRCNPRQPPTFEQYIAAASIHVQRPRGTPSGSGPHDAGGAIIHATPKALRSEYARQIAQIKRQHGR